MEALGPVTAQALAATLGFERAEVETTLAALESEGFAMRGAFTPDCIETEWCERRLLARIHRYTVDRLRREIEPVSTQDFMRFLCDWQHVSADQRKEGPDALAGILADLEGFEAPAAAWETEILPARMNHYDFAWLDDLCLAGRAVWALLSARWTTKCAVPTVRTTPIAILGRRQP
jgi:ATP-dependent Lhr-like helicase